MDKMICNHAESCSYKSCPNRIAHNWHFHCNEEWECARGILSRCIEVKEPKSKPQPSIAELMREIASRDYDTGIWEVNVQAFTYASSFYAWAKFKRYRHKKGGRERPDSVGVYGHSVEDALEGLLDLLEAKYVTFPHCGQPMAGKEKCDE